MFTKADNYCVIAEDFGYVHHLDNKIIEKLMQSIFFLEYEKLVYYNQSSFCQNLSTARAIINLIQNVQKAL